jgi:hypothetical protein
MLAGDGLPCVVISNVYQIATVRGDEQKAAPIWLPHWPVWR